MNRYFNKLNGPFKPVVFQEEDQKDSQIEGSVHETRQKLSVTRRNSSIKNVYQNALRKIDQQVISDFQQDDDSSKIGIKKQIDSKNIILNRLQNNQKFFKEICEQKLKGYLEQVKIEIKAQVYDKVIKQTLHQIYKHYDNLQKKTENQANQALQESIAKTKEISIQLWPKLESLEMNNNLEGKRLEMMINDSNVIKNQTEIIQNINPEELQRKLDYLIQNNHKLQEELLAQKQSQEQQIYGLKIESEIKARKLMEKRAVELAFESINVENKIEMDLGKEIKQYQEILETKKRQKQYSQLYLLQKQKKELEKQLKQISI